MPNYVNSVVGPVDLDEVQEKYRGDVLWYINAGYDPREMTTVPPSVRNGLRQQLSNPSVQAGYNGQYLRNGGGYAGGYGQPVPSGPSNYNLAAELNRPGMLLTADIGTLTGLGFSPEQAESAQLTLYLQQAETALDLIKNSPPSDAALMNKYQRDLAQAQARVDDLRQRAGMTNTPQARQQQVSQRQITSPYAASGGNGKGEIYELIRKAGGTAQQAAKAQQQYALLSPRQQQNAVTQVQQQVGTVSQQAAAPIAYGASPAGAGNQLVQDLINSFQQQSDSANAANEQRYQQALGELSGLRDRSYGRLDNLGQVERRDINEAFDQQLGRNTQSAINRGLYNTTILDSLNRGTEYDRSKAMLNLDDAINKQYLNSDAQLTQLIAGLIERRNDVGPDISQLAALLQNYGQSGAGNATYPATSGAGAVPSVGGAGTPVYGSSLPTPSAGGPLAPVSNPVMTGSSAPNAYPSAPQGGTFNTGTTSGGYNPSIAGNGAGNWGITSLGKGPQGQPVYGGPGTSMDQFNQLMAGRQVEPGNNWGQQTGQTPPGQMPVPGVEPGNNWGGGMWGNDTNVQIRPGGYGQTPVNNRPMQQPAGYGMPAPAQPTQNWYPDPNSRLNQDVNQIKQQAQQPAGSGGFTGNDVLEQQPKGTSISVNFPGHVPGQQSSYGMSTAIPPNQLPAKRASMSLYRNN